MKKIQRMLSLLLCILLLPLSALAGEAEDHLARSAEYIAAGDLKQALVSCRLALKAAPEALEPRLTLARLCILLEQWPEAQAAVDTALEMDPFCGEAHLMQMQCALHDGDLQAAENALLFADFCGVKPGHDLQAGLAALYSSEGQDARAAELFEKLPWDALSETQRAAWRQSLTNLGRGDEAQTLGTAQARSVSDLDALFESGTVYLQKTAIRGLPEEAVPGAISPDGSTVIFRDAEQGLCVLRTGRVRPVTWSVSRGVEDTHDNRKIYESIMFRYFPMEEDTVWSPDGRYAVMTAVRMALQNMQFTDLVMLDCETAELIQLTAQPRKIREAGAGSVLQARFDQSGRYLYYTQYATGQDYRYCFWRYDLQTGEHEMCLSTEYGFYAPNLWETESGQWINLLDTTSGRAAGGLNVFSERNGRWINTPVFMTVPRSWTELESQSLVPGGDMPYRFLRPTVLRYSANSGHAVMLVENATANLSALMRVSPENNFSGLDTYWTLRSLDQTRMEEMTQEDILAVFPAPSEDSSAALPTSGRVSILQFVLSPDGHYALLCVRQGQEGALLLLRLKDMALCRVNVPEDTVNFYMRSAMAAQFAPGMVWNEDGRLLILEHRGGDVSCYTLK